MPCGCMSLRSAVIVIGSAVFREVGVLHAAGFVESAVEFEGCLQGDGSLAAFAHLKIVEEQRAIDRVSAVVDDLVGAFDRILVTEIGDALIDHGQSVRLRAKGEPGKNGGSRGDLLVEVYVEDHKEFQRHDYDIYSTVKITYPRAALGGDIIIHTIDGDVAYNVKAGTQTGTRVRLRGKGVPSLRNKKMRGNHYVDLVVDVPSSLSREQKKLLEQLDETFEKKEKKKKK